MNKYKNAHNLARELKKFRLGRQQLTLSRDLYILSLRLDFFGKNNVKFRFYYMQNYHWACFFTISDKR